MGIKRYLFWALLSFVVLIGVQWHLIYNTYILKDRDFNATEKQQLNDAYGAHIPDDKLYPGAGRLIDSLLEVHHSEISMAYLKGQSSFAQKSSQLSTTFLNTLRERQVMDSVFNLMLTRLKLKEDLSYRLTLQSLEINFDDGKPNQFLIDNKNLGYPIAGNLKSLKLANRVTHLAVSGKSAFPYRITFNLFVDRADRGWQVFKEMIPTFLLVVVCVLVLMAINYYSYHHWLKQKKEADAKTDFLNSIAHEFNTPITTIAVASKTLNQDIIANNSAQVKEYAAIIARQTKKLETHVSQIINVSALEKSTTKEHIHLNRILDDLVKDYQINLQDNEHLSLNDNLENTLIEADLFVLMTVLNNLINNGLKHNGKLEKWVRLVLDVSGNSYVLKVIDNGDGIAENEQHKVFEKFYRPAKSKKLTGLGLGLYYVQNALTELGWKFDLQTKIGEGSVFSIFIPIQIK